VRGPDEAIVGAISVTGPTYRISDRDVKRIGAAVTREAASISQEIATWERAGYGPTSANRSAPASSRRILQACS